MIDAARDRDELSVVADQRGNPTSALDLADGILAIAAAGWRPNRQRQHLPSGRHGAASWFDFAGEVMAECRRLGLPAAEVRPIRTADWPTRAARPPFAVLDCARIERDLGLRLPDWRQSVADTVERLA